MTALDALPLTEAKAYLNVQDDADDELITSLITAAVQWVEKYTDYYLYQRSVVVDVYTSCYTTPAFPVNSVTPAGLTVKNYPLETRISGLPYAGGQLTLDVGYANADNIPATLITACKKLVVYWYENRDIYMAELPMDVQMLLNQFRRSATI